MKTDETVFTRREPKQQRSRQTVEAVLEAVQQVLKRHGVEAITTNRIAEAAGVSIGSLYQYFPAVAGSRATGARKLREDFLSAFPTHIRKGQNRACTHCTPSKR